MAGKYGTDDGNHLMDGNVTLRGTRSINADPEHIGVGGDDGLNVGDADLDGLGVKAGILLSW